MLDFLLIISETISALHLEIPTPRTWKRPLSPQKGASRSGFGLVHIFPLWMDDVLFGLGNHVLPHAWYKPVSSQQIDLLSH